MLSSYGFDTPVAIGKSSAVSKGVFRLPLVSWTVDFWFKSGGGLECSVGGFNSPLIDVKGCREEYGIGRAAGDTESDTVFERWERRSCRESKSLSIPY